MKRERIYFAYHNYLLNAGQITDYSINLQISQFIL